MVSVKLAMLLLVVAALEAVTAGTAEDKAALAPVLGKKYMLSSSDNFDEVLKELGVSATIRKMVITDRPVIELTENNGEYSLTYKSTLNNTDLRFRIGQEFTEETPDGRTVKSIITQKGNVLTHVQTGEKTTTIVMTFSLQEVKVVISVADKVATRIYKPE